MRYCPDFLTELREIDCAMQGRLSHGFPQRNAFLIAQFFRWIPAFPGGRRKS